ncbi:hypothetical protein PINS_up005677 [Pythium insidiosum]|nr:hypothetical protein PINS_up005677 [Pythium insidiosum]
MAMRPRELFGGALSCAIPDGFADVSSFRQVPDNQEVFANATTDQCIIIELLQYEADVRDEDSAQFFFNEIATSNGCAPGDLSMLHTQVLPAGSCERASPSAPVRHDHRSRRSARVQVQGRRGRQERRARVHRQHSTAQCDDRRRDLRVSTAADQRTEQQSRRVSAREQRRDRRRDLQARPRVVHSARLGPVHVESETHS